MICTSCRRTLIARIQNLPSSSTNALTSQTTRISLRGVATASSAKSSAPTSTSTSRDSPPFSEPFYTSTTNAAAKPAASSSPAPNAAAPIKLVSSVPGGTPLSSLTYTKQTTKPLLALEDAEYPSWLWKLV